MFPLIFEAFSFSVSSGFFFLETRLIICSEFLLVFCNTLLEVVLFVMFLGPIRLSPSLSRLAWLGFGPTSGIPMGLGRSSSLRIGGDSSAVSGSGRTSGESNRLAVVVLRDASREPPSPLGKGKDKIDEIKYSVGSKYLRSTVQNALAVGPSRVEPLYGEVFARRYRPPFGVQVWSLDVLTSYVVQVPKMVCFFEVAFENGLCFPLHPFIKRVLQHFNVCPSQLSPNFWGILIGLLVVFRDKGLGVPSIAMFLDLFSVKEAAEGFLYLSKRSSAPMIISDLPSSHKFWKERYFFVGGRLWEYDPTRAVNMGRARWAGPNWPDILEGQAVKLAARIKSRPIGPTRIGPQPIRVRAGPARLARIFF